MQTKIAKLFPTEEGREFLQTEDLNELYSLMALSKARITRKINARISFLKMTTRQRRQIINAMALQRHSTLLDTQTGDNYHDQPF